MHPGSYVCSAPRARTRARERTGGPRCGCVGVGTCTLAAAHNGAGPRRCTHRRRQGRDQEFYALRRNAEIAVCPCRARARRFNQSAGFFRMSALDAQNGARGGTIRECISHVVMTRLRDALSLAWNAFSWDRVRRQRDHVSRILVIILQTSNRPFPKRLDVNRSINPPVERVQFCPHFRRVVYHCRPYFGPRR